MASTVKREWAGPFDAELPDGRTVSPGDVVEIDAGEADSAHWRAPGSTAKSEKAKADS